jgi:hypothetical protein
MFETWTVTLQADEWVRKLLEADRGFADSLNSMSSAFYDSIIKEVEYVGPDGHPGVCEAQHGLMIYWADMAPGCRLLPNAFIWQSH